MALWHQPSPYFAKSLTDGLLSGVQSDTSRIGVFEFVSCHLEVDIDDFKEGERIDKVQLNFMDGTIQMCNDRGEFDGLLGWNLWYNGNCLWSSLDSHGFLFQEQKFSIDPYRVHYFDCTMHHDVPPFRKGERVPIILLDWKNQRIKMFDDPSGRMFEGMVGWFILKKGSQFVSFDSIKRKYAGKTPGIRTCKGVDYDSIIPSLCLPPPALDTTSGNFMRYLSDQ